MAALTKHTKEQREFIVRRLAQYYTPRSIAGAFVARYRDTACTENDVTGTDPQHVIVDPDLHAIYVAERAATIENAELLAPAAQKSVRLLLLQRDLDDAISRDHTLAKQTVLKLIRDEQNGDGETVGNLADVPTHFERVIIDPKEPDGNPS